MEDMVNKLNKLMAEKGLTCMELSKKTGIANTTLSTLLKGRTDKFDIVKLKKICQVLGCSLDYLMNDDSYDIEPSSCYYVNEEVAEYAQELARNKDLKMLFDAAKNIKKEDMQLVYEMIKRFKSDSE